MPRLQIFDGESFAPRWLELEPGRTVTAGRAPDCEVVLLCPRVARHHFRFVFHDGRWQVEDLGSQNVTCRNGERVSGHRTPLAPGDMVSVAEIAIVFDPPDDDLPRNLPLEAAIERNAGEEGPVSVWADWLLEQRHPLGERIVRGIRGPRDGDAPWSGHLADFGRSFTVAIGWRFGLIDSFEVRSDRQTGAYRALIARLLTLPAARCLRRLRFELLACHGAVAADAGAEVDDLIRAGVPATLTSLDLGYGEEGEDVIIDGDLAKRAPGLAGSTVFLGRARCRLILEQAQGAAAKEIGSASEVRPRLALRTGGDQLRLAWSHGERPEPLDVRFTRNDGRWSLEGRPQAFDALLLNGRRATTHGLIHGDRLSAGGTVYRFEVLPAGRAAPLSPAG